MFYDPKELFELNPDREVREFNRFKQIINYYKNPHDIEQMLLDGWKPTKRKLVGDSNGKNYYDSKPILQFDGYETFKFNLFKNISLTNEYQSVPHIDGYTGTTEIIYLSKENGGTALYKGSAKQSSEIENDWMIQTELEVLYLHRGIFNSCFIFPSNIPHGFYIKDQEKQKEFWRITQVKFNA